MHVNRNAFALAASLGVGLAAAAATFAGASSRPPEDITASYAALARPATAADQLPARIVRGIGAMNAAPVAVAAGQYEGQHLPDRARALLERVGAEGLSVYAYPTSKGRVCFTTSRGGGGCVERRQPFAWGAFLPAAGQSGMFQLFGLAPNGVTSVTVVSGVRESAALLDKAHGPPTQAGAP